MYLKSKKDKQSKKNKQSKKDKQSKNREKHTKRKQRKYRKKTSKNKTKNKNKYNLAGAPPLSTSFAEYFAKRGRQRQIKIAAQKEKDRLSRIMNALASECTICLEPMDKDNNKNNNKNHVENCLACLKSNDIPTQLPCDHFFHDRCIQKWKREHNDCPLCRHPIQPHPTEPHHTDYY